MAGAIGSVLSREWSMGFVKRSPDISKGSRGQQGVEK